MTVSIELLDALKSAQGGISDYRIAQMLGVNQTTITKYRKDTIPLSAEKVILACNLAGLNATSWLLRLHIERAKGDAEKLVWNDLLHKLAA